MSGASNVKKYEMLARPIEFFSIRLLPLTKIDLELVRSWRNHPDVFQYMLHQENITKQGQIEWFEKIEEDKSLKNYLIFYRDEPIGLINIKAVNLTDLIGSAVIEVGMYLAPDSRYRGTLLAFSPAVAINKMCFYGLGCEQLRAVVLNDNKSAIRFNQKLGYHVESVGARVTSMNMNKRDYDRAMLVLKKVLR